MAPRSSEPKVGDTPGSPAPPLEKKRLPQKFVVIVKDSRSTLNSSSRADFGNAGIPNYRSYSQVDVKELRRPTVTDLSNQKDIAHKISGWKFRKMLTQMGKVVEAQDDMVAQMSSLLDKLTTKAGPNPSPEINRIIELFKVNIQKSAAIRDQISNERAQGFKLMEVHKPQIVEIITEYMKKKSARNKELFWK